MKEGDVAIELLGVVRLKWARLGCSWVGRDEGGDALITYVPVDLVVEVGITSRGGWVSGSGGIGVAGVVPTVVWGRVGHFLGGTG